MLTTTHLWIGMLGLAAAVGGSGAGAQSAMELEARTVAAAGQAVASDQGPGKKAGRTQVGSASFYANSLAGRRTASGERYSPGLLTAAHRTLPLGSMIRVTNLTNGRSVHVRVNDRGPFAKGRILDLSRAAAERLGFIKRGHTRVKIEVLGHGGR